MRITLPGQLDLPNNGADIGAAARARSAAPLRPAAPQAPLDFGLFGDDSLQTDLIEMLLDPEFDED